MNDIIKIAYKIIYRNILYRFHFQWIPFVLRKKFYCPTDLLINNDKQKFKPIISFKYNLISIKYIKNSPFFFFLIKQSNIGRQERT